MVSIDEELGVAKALKATINTLSITTPKTAILATLRKANHAAILNLGRGGALFWTQGLQFSHTGIGNAGPCEAISTATVSAMEAGDRLIADTRSSFL
jgi:hypothetical protein